MKESQSQDDRQAHTKSAIDIWLNIIIITFISLGALLMLLQSYRLYEARIDASTEQRDALLQQLDDMAQANENGDASDDQSALITTIATDALTRAEDSVGRADGLLSFLEGAAVLVGLALGAAALVGYRNTREIRTEMRQEMEEMKVISKRLEENRSYLENLPKSLEEFQDIRSEYKDQLKIIRENATYLMAATKELELGNHQQAYRYINFVIKDSQDNPQALYMAGWLEMQYIPNKKQEGVEKLKEAIDIDSENPSYTAALGVALKRRASDAKEKDDMIAYESDYAHALAYLLEALHDFPHLVDLNRESFWGPVGGIYRDMGRIDDAIKAYNDALKVTPGSSYPQGNLATLYLQKAKSEQETPEKVEKVLKEFEEALKMARTELGYEPTSYFLMMDIAMSSTMLIAEDGNNQDEAARWLTNALKTTPTAGMLNVSLGGWKRLKDYCLTEWSDSRTFIEQAITQVEEAIKNAPRDENTVEQEVDKTPLHQVLRETIAGLQERLDDLDEDDPTYSARVRR